MIIAGMGIVSGSIYATNGDMVIDVRIVVESFLSTRRVDKKVDECSTFISGFFFLDERKKLTFFSGVISFLSYLGQERRGKC